MTTAAPRFTFRALASARRALRAGLPLLALVAGGCGMLDAKLEARTVCYTLPSYPIPGALAAGTLSVPIDFDLGHDLPIVSDPGVSYSLVLQRARLAVSAGSPAVDLGGIDELALSVQAPPGTSLSEPELLRYRKGADPHPTTLEAASSSDADLAPYMTDGRVRFLATASGALPDYEWSADFTACFLLTVDVKYGKKL